MIITKYSYRKLNIGDKKIKLPINIRQYEYENERSLNKLSNKEKEKHLYSMKYYGVEFRKKMIKNLYNKYELSPIQLDILATYLIDIQKDGNILSLYKLNKIQSLEIPFSNFDDLDAIDNAISDLDEIVETKDTIKIKYSEKQTKLYKLSNIPYIPNKSRWVTPNTNNVFEFDGVSYIINKDNKNYKCDAQNTSEMDRVFCAYTNDGIEFYDMKIDKIDAQLLQ